MNRALPDALVTPTAEDIEHVAHLDLPDEADRHVLAAVIAADAGLLCTTNLRDFPPAATAAAGTDAVSPDELPHALTVAFPAEMTGIHHTVVAQMPHSTDEDTLAALDRAGAPRAVAALRATLPPR